MPEGAIMKKSIVAFIVITAVLLASVSCGSGDNKGAQSVDPSEINIQDGDIPDGISYFSDSDYKDVSSGTCDAVIALSGSTGTISDTSRGSSGPEVTVTSKGVYRVNGSSQNVTITINDAAESGNVYLILDNVVMTNSSAPCINVEAADKVIVFSTGVNTLSCTSSDKEAVIYAKDDITFGGNGSLTIRSAQHGIIGKDDVKLTGSDIAINSDLIGIKVNESFRMGGGKLSITAGRDGIQVGNSAGNGFFYLETGILSITSAYDGVSLTSGSESTNGYVLFAGGTANITAGGGHDSPKDPNVSQKGVKSAGTVSVKGTALTISSADDAINSSGNVYISKGNVLLDSSDDGIHADNSLTVSGGTLHVNANGDGLDSNGSIFIKGGMVIVEGPADNEHGTIDAGNGEGCVASITGGTVLALGSAETAINFNSGTQCSALVSISGPEGTTITADDGSGFTWSAAKSFECAVYSSPYMTQGNTYTLTAGSVSVTMDFASDLYYSNVESGQ